ncbi:putative disease resistance RPP13-like protein 2 [Aegilops tauschii subsp. strangulata]|uniref:Putative disease resistance RPP13-like protein 2 n=1 Tax=Aegilops tauschii TaxID=37682 RepID=M8BKR5_AEGTA
MNRRDGYEDAIGLHKDVKTVKNMLLREDHPQQMFISILGESGVGKSTLIKAILRHRVVINQFEIIVGHDLPPDMTAEEILQEIYSRASSEGQCQLDEGIDITDKLRHILEKKRYLVVIGEISSKTILNCVRASLPEDNNASRVLLVLDSESEEVAWHANSMNKDGINGIHMLGRLDEKRSGELFCWRAFRKEVFDVKEDTSKYDNIVHDITGGYPLAIVLLAGLLRFKEKPGQWEAVLQQLRHGPGTRKEAQGVEGNKMSSTTQDNLSTRTTLERVFWESFEDLPNDLKSCFLYLVACPKNTSIDVDVIVRMWMAEGFIKPQSGKTMEELGYNFLKELALRCLVHIEKMNRMGKIELVSVHRSLYQFLYSEAREAGFIDVHGMHDIFVPPSEKDPSNDSQSRNHKGQNDLKFLRGSKFLRVISVRGLRIKELPSEIGDMVHLRYLAVTECEDLKELLFSIKGLLNLQTLDMRVTQVEEIHPSFWKIKTLRHVLADKLTLPASIKEELDELQTLWGVKPALEGEWDQGSCPLHKMTKLRTLYLHGFNQFKHGAALESALGKMSLLENLWLDGDEIPLCVFTAQSLRYLQTVWLGGTIKWPEAGYDVRKVRPNLVRLTVTVVMDSSEEVPQHIKDELHGILVVKVNDL